MVAAGVYSNIKSVGAVAEWRKERMFWRIRRKLGVGSVDGSLILAVGGRGTVGRSIGKGLVTPRMLEAREQ